MHRAISCLITRSLLVIALLATQATANPCQGTEDGFLGFLVGQPVTGATIVGKGLTATVYKGMTVAAPSRLVGAKYYSLYGSVKRDLALMAVYKRVIARARHAAPPFGLINYVAAPNNRLAVLVDIMEEPTLHDVMLDGDVPLKTRETLKALWEQRLATLVEDFKTHATIRNLKLLTSPFDRLHYFRNGSDDWLTIATFEVKTSLFTYRPVVIKSDNVTVNLTTTDMTIIDPY